MERERKLWAVGYAALVVAVLGWNLCLYASTRVQRVNLEQCQRELAHVEHADIAPISFTLPRCWKVLPQHAVQLTRNFDERFGVTACLWMVELTPSEGWNAVYYCDCGED